ncbi:MAG: hypothetical protein AAGC93_04970 [Cyanobacteria bacterium P01_F01_bin.53]
MLTKHPLHWNLVTVASLFLVLTSALILSNGLDEACIFLALRVSSLTTALPFFLVFAMQPLQRLGLTREMGLWAQQYARDLWVIAAVSHLIHLAQIGLYYTLGRSCSAISWALTAPMWLILVWFAGLAIVQPSWFNSICADDSAAEYVAEKAPLTRARLYQLGSWYVWLIFVGAFVGGAAAQHLLFYNLPAAILFIAAAILRVLPRRIVPAH